MNLRHWITQTDKGQTIYGKGAQTSHIFIMQLYIPPSKSSQYSPLYLFASACRGPTREGEIYSPNWHVRSLTSGYLSPTPQANSLQAGDIWIHCFSLYPVFHSLPAFGSSVGKESACNAGDPSSIPGLGKSTREGIGYPLQYCWASVVAHLIKNLAAMRETWVQSLVWEDSLEK